MPDERIKPQGTIISFDFGFRRIGVAVGQTLTGSANALTVVSFANQADWQAIKNLLDDWKPAAIVVGLPLAEDGGETDMSKGARKFGHQLEGRFSIPVWFEDERLTSIDAEERFIDARARGEMRRKDASLKDAIAAQIILESWLQS